MASLQAFDGDTLEAALERVTEACGPNARITQAEKVRSGGIAGFFARERFEVTVEIDDRPVAEADADEAAAVKSPRSLLDLVDQTSEAERLVTRPGGAGDARPDTDAAVAVGRTDVPSTEGPTFQEVLRGIASQAGLLEPPAAPSPGTGPAAASETVPRTVTDPWGAPDPVPAHPWAVEAGDGVRLEGDRALFASLGVPRQLLFRSATPGSVAQRLLALLEGIPAAPPVIARRGEVVAVVGDGHAAVDAAAVLARELGQSADDVIVAAPDQRGFNPVRDAAEAEARAAMWRRCGTPLVVAICATPGPAGAAWVGEMRRALAPVAMWGAVRADRKPEDIAAWVESVGGVDALAVSGCGDTATPAAVLATGIPVASLEGRRASAAAWTALLVERLAV